jgi:hypothetical protein
MGHLRQNHASMPPGVDKRCVHCGETKPVAEFRPNRTVTTARRAGAAPAMPKRTGAAGNASRVQHGPAQSWGPQNSPLSWRANRSRAAELVQCPVSRPRLWRCAAFSSAARCEPRPHTARDCVLGDLVVTPGQQRAGRAGVRAGPDRGPTTSGSGAMCARAGSATTPASAPSLAVILDGLASSLDPHRIVGTTGERRGAMPLFMDVYTIKGGIPRGMSRMRIEGLGDPGEARRGLQELLGRREGRQDLAPRRGAARRCCSHRSSRGARTRGGGDLRGPAGAVSSTARSTRTTCQRATAPWAAARPSRSSSSPKRRARRARPRAAGFPCEGEPRLLPVGRLSSLLLCAISEGTVAVSEPL